MRIKSDSLCIAAISFYLLTLCYAGHAQSAPKQVLAFYYGWCGNPMVSDRWIHWKDVDPERHRTGASTHFPEMGAYDSHDPQVVNRQIDEARAAGITGFIASWWGRGDFTDTGLPMLLAAARTRDTSITAMYETIRANDTEEKVEPAVRDLEYNLTRYGPDAAWRKAGRKPVVFIYGRALRQLALGDWSRVVRRVHEDLPGGMGALIPSKHRSVTWA